MKHKHMNAERRRHPRINERLQFRLKTDSFDVVAETTDISCIGAYCQVNKYIPLMTILEIVLGLPYGDEGNELEYLQCNGVVVRVDKVSPDAEVPGAYNIAIFFSDIAEREKQKIMRFVEAHRHMPTDVAG